MLPCRDTGPGAGSQRGPKTVDNGWMDETAFVLTDTVAWRVEGQWR